MSKRGAESQRMGQSDEFESSTQQMERNNNKASAAVMANRK